MRNLFLIFGLLFCQASFAGEFQYGNNITITRPVYHDLYLAAGNVIIDAPVYGDLVVAGGTVHINDSVMSDIMLAGGSVFIKGYVGDDIRCVGGNISVAGHVAGDLVVAGGNVKLERDASVESLFVSGGEISVAGIVRESVISTAGNFLLTGNILKDATLRGGKIDIDGNIQGKASLAASREIVFGRNAHIGRSISYWLPLKRPLRLPPNVSTQQPVYDALLSITHSRWYFLGASTFLGLLWYLGMAFIMIALVQYLFSSTFRNAGKTFHTNPVRSAAIGVGYFIGIPVAIVVFAITIIGVPVAAILAVGYLVLALLATVISSVVIVNWASYISDRSWNFWRVSGMGLITFVLLKIISFTPFFGWLVMMIIAAMAFGAIISNIKLKREAGVIYKVPKTTVTSVQ